MRSTTTAPRRPVPRAAPPWPDVAVVAGVVAWIAVVDLAALCLRAPLLEAVRRTGSRARRRRVSARTAGP